MKHYNSFNYLVEIHIVIRRKNNIMHTTIVFRTVSADKVIGTLASQM